MIRSMPWFIVSLCEPEALHPNLVAKPLDVKEVSSIQELVMHVHDSVAHVDTEVKLTCLSL